MEIKTVASFCITEIKYGKILVENYVELKEIENNCR